MSLHQKLESPWHALERIPGQAAVRAVWQRHFRQSAEHLLAACFEPAPEKAEFIPCESCGCAHRVIPGDSEGLVAVCCCKPCECADRSVSAGELVVWRLSWARLGRQLCAAFDLWPRAADLGVRHTRQVGVWSAASVPVLLSICTSATAFRAAVAEVCSRLNRSFMLITPTGQFVDALCEELFAHAGAAWFSLEAYATLDGAGVLRTRVPAGKLFSRFQPTVDDSKSEVATQALELLVRLDSELRLKPPSLVTVFKFSCRDGLSAERIARKCGCSKATVINRLRLLQEKTGLSSAQMQQVSSHLEDALETAKDPRASRLHRRNLIEDADEDGF